MNGSVRPYQTPAGVTKWEFVVELGRGPDGRRKQARRRGFATERAAVEAMQEELVGRRRGTFVDPARTPLADYLAEWLEVTGPSRAPSSNAALAVAVKRILPGLGAVPLGKLQPQQVQRWLNDLAARYAPATVEVTRTTLVQALAQAVEWRLIADNPARTVRAPRPRYPAEPKAEKVWSAEECRRFLAAAAGTPWEALWRVLLDGQLRLGEARALRWTDLDLDAGVVKVRRTLTHDAAGHVAMGDRPKTPSSLRDVSVSAETVAALRRHRAAQAERRLALGPAWDDQGLVFAGRSGGVASAGAIRGALTALADRAGVPRLTPHGLRHTGTTLLMEAGVPAKIISERLGHKGIAITLDIYAHATPKADRAASDTLARILAG